MEDQQAKGKCLGTDLHMGKMPAQLFDILVEGGGGLRALPHQRGGNVLTHPSYFWLKGLLSFATSPTLWATRKSFWWSNLSHSCCLREPLSSACPTPTWRADESYPLPLLRCHMTGGKKSQGSADLPEVRRELPPSGQMRPTVLLPLVTCKPCLESAYKAAKAAGQESVTCGSCHVPNLLRGTRKQPGVVQRGRVVQWLRAWPRGSESLYLALHSFLCGLGQVIYPHGDSVVSPVKCGFVHSPASTEHLVGARHCTRC